MNSEQTKTTEERDKAIHQAGRKLAEVMSEFYGKITLNLQGGKYVNANIEESLKEKT
jgi:hypothetical protein